MAWKRSSVRSRSGPPPSLKVFYLLRRICKTPCFPHIIALFCDRWSRERVFSEPYFGHKRTQFSNAEKACVHRELRCSSQPTTLIKVAVFGPIRSRRAFVLRTKALCHFC